MSDMGVNISLADTLPYLEQRFLSIFGKDAESTELASWFKSIQTTATQMTAGVQCVGMQRPIPFHGIYQPTRLIVKGRLSDAGESFSYEDRAGRSIALARITEERSVPIQQFLADKHDAIIFAGPGWGKTTFLHHVFRCCIRDEHTLPVLITLRRPTAVEDLERFLEAASRIQKRQHKSRTLLLVDGYDEISVKQRQYVSDALLKYQALEIGNFFLTCRDYYEVSQISAPEVRIDGFTLDEKYAFVKAFLAAFQSPLNHIEVVDEFETRGFSEFLSHPLLLALACIGKTSPSAIQPRSALRLLERALDVLCYRWDEKKGISRECVTPLDGKDRIKILRRIAYTAKSPHLPRSRAELEAAKQINLMNFDKVDPRQALMEIAKFYGILVPSEDGYEFVHRTIHDFLAAQYWVETGAFARTTHYDWSSRTAYAACLSEDATSILEAALAAQDGLPAVAEIFNNAPSFDMKRIAAAINSYFSKPSRVLYLDHSVPNRIAGNLGNDFIRLLSNRFLNFLVENYACARSAIKDVIVGHCLLELAARKLKLDYNSYSKAIDAYSSEKFTFNIIGIAPIQLGFLQPVNWLEVSARLESGL
jgi:hypothetical protein